MNFFFFRWISICSFDLPRLRLCIILKKQNKTKNEILFSLFLFARRAKMHKLMQSIDRRFVTFCASSPSRAPVETRIRRPLPASPYDEHKTSMIRACLRRHATFWNSFCAQQRLDHLLPMCSKHSKLAFSPLKLSTCKTEWVSSEFYFDFRFRSFFF